MSEDDEELFDLLTTWLSIAQGHKERLALSARNCWGTNIPALDSASLYLSAAALQVDEAIGVLRKRLLEHDMLGDG